MMQLCMAWCAWLHVPPAIPGVELTAGPLLRTRLLANAPLLLPLPCNPAQCRRHPALPLAEKPWHPLTFRNMARVYEKEQVRWCRAVHTRVSCGIAQFCTPACSAAWCSVQCSAA